MLNMNSPTKTPFLFHVDLIYIQCMYNLNIKLPLMNVFGDLTSMNICVIPEEYILVLYDVSYNGCM